MASEVCKTVSFPGHQPIISMRAPHYPQKVIYLQERTLLAILQRAPATVGPMTAVGTMHKCVDPRSADRAPISRAAQPVSQPKGQLLARNRRPIFAPQPWGSLLLLRQREARCYPAVAAEELTQQFGAIALLTPV